MLRIMEEGLYGFVGKESGVMIALRKEGDEILFASRENAPLRWVSTSDFTPDPHGLLTPEEAHREHLGEDLEDDSDD